ncbi:polymer-forming cytoskeletal protein [Rhodohalobacter sp. SW132]|uniref:bactofilin family protein n=1 Tax=Rhodohalobacter sp. SW132 TaxID=2293433 RepID=UPI000E22BEC5|nr:polymer-forming cytoskeletal protein [Rhodohalobacter sp. SW132]REL33317.1 polymer-forming cytoskeletal protein [Rhodohalobacter sp. SW132]
MFKKEDKRTVTGSKNQSPTLNMISEGTTLTGKITTENDIRIAGKADGEIDSKGKLIVTSSGVVKGGFQAQDADIAGKVEGEIRVSNKLTLRQSAVINGDIYTKTLIVEEGAEMNGECRMGKQADEKKSQAAVSASGKTGAATLRDSSGTK